MDSKANIYINFLISNNLPIKEILKHLPLSYQHLYGQENECNGEEIHVLLVIFLEHNRIELLLVHILDFGDDGIQAEFLIAGADIGTASGPCDILQDILIEPGNDNSTVLLPQV